MMSSNALFGNAQVLAAYASMRHPLFPPTIAGFVQPWLRSEIPSEGSKKGLPAFIWGPAARRRRHLAGLGNHSPIGAPWLYLLELAQEDRIPRAPIPEEDRPAEPDGGQLLYFPHHGLSGEHAAAARADAIRRGSQQVTVALTHEQSANEGTRHAYLEAGANVVDLGTNIGDVGAVEPFFLERLLYLMKAHQSIQCDELNVFALFGHAAGIPVNAQGTSAATLDALTREELGTDCVMPPAELRALFDWSNHA